MSASTAEGLARGLHAAQVDQSGQPYVDHLAAVCAILLRRWPDAPEFAIEAAWLHDAIEDTAVTAPNLLAAGISAEAVRLIEALTRPADLSYRTWIAKLADAGNLWTIRIKLADNEHNSDPTRRLPGSDIVERRYIPAKRKLEAALIARNQPLAS